MSQGGGGKSEEGQANFRSALTVLSITIKIFERLLYKVFYQDSRDLLSNYAQRSLVLVYCFQGCFSVVDCSHPNPVFQLDTGISTFSVVDLDSVEPCPS